MLMVKELPLGERNNIRYCMTSQNVSEVENIFKKICGSNEDLFILNIHLAVFFQEKNYELAMDEVTAAIDKFDRAEYRAYLILRQGQISEFQGNFNGGLRFYYHTLAIGKWPLYVRYYLWNKIAFCWLLKQKYKSAEMCYRKAFKLDPKRWNAWKSLGGSLERRGKLIEALQCYFQAILLFRRDREYIFHD